MLWCLRTGPSWVFGVCMHALRVCCTHVCTQRHALGFWELTDHVTRLSFLIVVGARCRDSLPILCCSHFSSLCNVSVVICVLRVCVVLLSVSRAEAWPGSFRDPRSSAPRAATALVPYCFWERSRSYWLWAPSQLFSSVQSDSICYRYVHCIVACC